MTYSSDGVASITGNGAYHQVDSSSPVEGELKGELFAGDHTPDGVFESLKGMAMTPPELSYSVQDENIGEVRYQGIELTPGTDWKTHGPVVGGEFEPFNLTRGTDKHMPR